MIDIATLEVMHDAPAGPGGAALEFTPRGEQAWVSVRDADRVQVYDTATFERLATLPADKPSGIFFTARAQRIGL